MADVTLTATGPLVLLDDIDWDRYIEAGDVTEHLTWPPQRFWDRDERLRLYRLLWAGGWPHGVTLGPNPVTVNVFAAYTMRLANLLMMSEPMTSASVDPDGDLDPPIGLRNPLIDICHDALTDMVRYGGAILLRTGDAVIVPDPLAWYPGAEPGVHYFARTELDASLGADRDEIEPNVLEITRVDSMAGSATVQRRRWSDAGSAVGTIGPILATESVDDVAVEVVPRDPRAGIWGTSKYVAMYSPALEIARRYSTNSQILDLYSGPIPVFQESDLDARARYGVLPTDTADEAQQKILEGQLGMISDTTIHLPDNILSISYLQPNVQGTNYALTQVTDLREHIRDVTGLPDLTGQTVSGDALKRLFVHFYAETSALQLGLRLALERLLGQPVDWPHIFDSDMFAAPAMSPPEQPAASEPETM